MTQTDLRRTARLVGNMVFQIKAAGENFEKDYRDGDGGPPMSMMVGVMTK